MKRSVSTVTSPWPAIRAGALTLAISYGCPLCEEGQPPPGRKNPARSSRRTRRRRGTARMGAVASPRALFPAEPSGEG